MERLGPMLGICSSGPSLAWNWIIEYLSSFPQIDTSTVCRLIDTSPLLPEDLGKDTNEMVALRCLEELFDPQNSIGSVTPPVSRVAFNPSHSCNAVLQRILREVPLSNLKNAGPELLRWDGEPFIKHKRATLPKCALEKLKDFILVDGTVSGGDEKGPPSDDKKGNQEGNLIPQIRKKGTKMFLDFDTLLGRNTLPSKRCREDLVAGNSTGVVNVDQGSMHDDLPLNVKKFKQDGDQELRVASSSQTSTSINGLQQNTDPGEEKAMPSRDPVKEAGWTEQKSCVKCNKNGQVLVCSGCPVVVHESCLNCAARFDDKGNFLCPFCAYSVSISKYKEAKDKTILARKKLASFVGIMGKLAQEQVKIRSHRTLPESENSEGEESSSTAEDKFIVSSYSTRSKIHEPKISFPPTFELRRKKDPWTNDEEEMLRKGVQEFANEGGTVPWTRILEMGNQVFLKNRTTTDLKNKWRSMCKGSPKGK